MPTTSSCHTNLAVCIPISVNTVILLKEQITFCFNGLKKPPTALLKKVRISHGILLRDLDSKCSVSQKCSFCPLKSSQKVHFVDPLPFNLNSTEMSSLAHCVAWVLCTHLRRRIRFFLQLLLATTKMCGCKSRAKSKCAGLIS